MALNKNEQDQKRQNGARTPTTPTTPTSPSKDCFSRNGVKTGIPVPTFVKRPSMDCMSLSFSGSPDKWKTKYEECERKRKVLIAQCQKVERDNEDLQKKTTKLSLQQESILQELQAKDEEIAQLRKLSEAMYKEYDQLRNKYDLDTGALQQAIKRASQWYKQNRELKRKSTALVQKVMQVAPQAVLEVEDETDSNNEQDEVENLRRSIQELNTELARIQTELSSAKLQEFEAQEQAMELQAHLEEERNAKNRLQSEVDELKATKDNLGHVTRLVAQEVTNLREQCEKEKETSQKLKTDADTAKRERNILAHQSQLLMFEVSSDEKLMKALLEMENLKRALDEEQQKHATEIQKIQDKLEDEENDAKAEILEERLKLIESELNCALQRAERAETYNDELNNKVKQLEGELEKKSQQGIPPPPPPPPPLSCAPPPPPLPPLPAFPGGQGLTNTLQRGNSTANKENTSVVEMAQFLGIKRAAKPNATVQPAAIDEIINEIKGGRFTLKRSEKQKDKVKEEKPAVVQEMMNILGTLRRRPGGRTPSFRCKQTELTTTDSANITI